MKFIVDECTGPFVARWLKDKEYQIFSIYDEAMGWADHRILKKANKEELGKKFTVVSEEFIRFSK